MIAQILLELIKFILESFNIWKEDTTDVIDSETAIDNSNPTYNELMGRFGRVSTSKNKDS